MSEINHESMIALGETDQAIFELKMKLRAIPNKLAEARKQLDAEQAQLNDIKTPHAQLSEEIRERESASKLATDTIGKFEEHMKKVTTQKEYLAASKQVDEARKLNDRLQEEILERRVKVEELEPALKECQGRYDNVLESYQSEERTLNQEKAVLEAEVEKHMKVVEKELEKLGANAAKYYHRLMNSGKMPAIVPTESGSCNGCNMALPPQLFNQLIASQSQMFTCPTCARIVFYKPPAEEKEEAQAAAG